MQRLEIKPQCRNSPHKGFALIATLSLMVLLAILAVGLLSLSSVALRSTSQGKAQAEARANARLSLMLAIGELQLELGPDRRINCQAGIDTEALPDHRNWLAVYDAWNASEKDRPDAGTKFRRYLVSGDRQALGIRDAAKSTLPGGSIALVSTGTLGKGAIDGQVKAGLVPHRNASNVPSGHHAWWIGDNNAKAMVNAGQDVPPSVSDELLAQHAAQSAPGTGYKLLAPLAGINGTGRADWELGDDLRVKALSLASMDLLPGASAGIGKNFHDVTAWAPGLLADVRNGRLKRDLSLYLQQDMTTEFRQRLRQSLYSVPSGGAQVNFSPDSEQVGDWDKLGQSSGITMEELWLFYNLPQQVSYSRPASSDAKVGVISSGFPTLVAANSREGVVRDPFYPYKREIYSQVKYFISLAAVPNTTTAGAGKFDLRLSVDPVIVLWNPHNVAMEYQTGAFTTVSFSSLPYEITFDVTGAAGSKVTGPLHFDSFFNDVNGIQAQTGKAHRIILRPGESRVLSSISDKAFAGDTGQVDVESGWEHTTGALFNSGAFPKALASTDKVKVTLKPRIASQNSDYITYWFGARTATPTLQSGTITLLNDMKIDVDLPEVITPQAYSVSDIVAERKMPMMLFSYYLRPERDTPTPSKSWVWNNPSIAYRWPADSTLASKLHRQFEMKVLGVDTPENPYLQITPDNQAYWGGGVRADFGVPFFIHRNIPLTPPLSLAAFQHSCANGFRRHWKDSPIRVGGAFPSDAFGLDGHQYLAPMVSKAIGNSFAQPLIAGERVEGTLTACLGTNNGGVAQAYNIADHSYLANAALWDSWYLSSLGPQTMEPYGSDKRPLQKVFDDFYPAAASTKPVPLPSVRMRPYRRSDDETVLRNLVRSGKPAEDAYRKLAAHLTVDGAFNVNSTSVDAWKVVLGSLRGHSTARRDRASASLLLESSSTGETPVNGLIVAGGPLAKPSANLQEPDQWTGYRALSDEDIEKLAISLVEEIRIRGPFLCLSDFINRRPGNDATLARQGTLQAAIEKAEINGILDNDTRALGEIAGAAFPESGVGSRASGIPGYITQADLLTPLGSTLQARSDSFTIRAYGEATDSGGKVLARAWCEATIQRVPEYIDPADHPDVTDLALTSAVNRSFGRQLRITGFRWLNSEEI